MSIRVTKSQVQKIATLLDQEWDSPEQAAEQVLAAAIEIVESRAKYSVFGQVYYSPPDGYYLSAEDKAATKVCLGFFSTKGDADKAANSLFTGVTTEQARTAVVEVSHMTPHEWYKERKEHFRQRDIERMKAARYRRDCCEHCDHLPGGVGSGHIGACIKCPKLEVAA